MTDPAAKPLKGFGGQSVMEIVAPFDGNTWRGIYTVRFKSVIYVLHVFQKKSKSGIATPKSDIELIHTGTSNNPKFCLIKTNKEWCNHSVWSS